MEPRDIARLLTEDIRVNNGLLLEREPSVRTTAEPEPEVAPEAPPEDIKKAEEVESGAMSKEAFSKAAQGFIAKVFKNFPNPGKAYQVARADLGLKFSGVVDKSSQKRLIKMTGPYEEYWYDPFDDKEALKAAKHVAMAYRNKDLPPEERKNAPMLAFMKKGKEFTDKFNAAMGSDMGAAKALGMTVKQVGDDEFEVDLPLNYDWDEGEQAAADVKSLVQVIKPSGEVEQAKRVKRAGVNKAAKSGEYMVGL
jgi:hypothetical protein